MASIASLSNLEQSLRDTLQKEAADSERRQQAALIQKQAWEQQHRQQAPSAPGPRPGGKSFGENDEELSKAAIASARAKEHEIEKRKLEVRVKVQAQLTRVGEEARRLDELRRELEGLEDPTKKEVAEIRKKIESVDRDLRPLKQMCERKEKEFKESVEAYNEKSKIKTDLVTRLMEIVTESERQRMRKLDELNKHLEAMEKHSNMVQVSESEPGLIRRLTWS